MDKYKMKMTARFSIINKTLSQIRKKLFFPALASFFFLNLQLVKIEYKHQRRSCFINSSDPSKLLSLNGTTEVLSFEK